MNDLERLWDDLPVGPAPVADIMRAGGRRPARRRVVRPLVRGAVVAGIAAAFVAGVLVGQPSPDGGRPGPVPPGGDTAPITPAAFHGDLQPAASCEALRTSYVERALEIVGPFGWQEYGYRGPWMLDGAMARGGLPSPSPAGAASSQVAKSYQSLSSATGTNVQEAGVDEPDHVKTDGEVLVRVEGDLLTTYDVGGEEVSELASLDLGDLLDAEILLAGDTVVAIGRLGRDGAGTRVVTVDVADPATPVVVETVDYTSALVTARQHGQDVRLVLQSGLPDLPFVEPRRGGGTGKERRRDALRANREVVRASTLDDWIPRVAGEAGTEQLVACGDVAIPEADLALDTMAVVGFAADSPAELRTLGLAGSAPLAYESPDHLYLATQADPWGWCCFDSIIGAPRTVVPVDDGVTHVFDFALDGVGASYVGSGEVEGAVADRWSMDEHDGVLRLAVGPTQETGDFNSVVTLQAQGDELVEIGRLDHLGDGEQIQSVRWFGSLAIVVTYRQIDPLYAVDLTDQAAPRLGGELKIPGFSEYLHPLGQHWLVGMGQGPGERGRWGAQVSLFNIHDLARPRRLDVLKYAGGSTAMAGQDPRQFTWLGAERVALTVVERGRTGYVSVLSFAGEEIANRMVEVDHGRDVADIRLVPLPEGRVALVTADDVELFPL
ncbi:beta-propeller domain-containing protein [Nocardioides sp. cx-173]|uniref:beta-propeller domain-containing protein n=1 Tax=Nocardioides sp. cx-173 TaxID=2898796 RepID=UPI001E3A94B2|nr:beta-propeller domain-containing protein [Nocardioides sp. cx-173]MCD4523971.1 beta-propeller domain-containing protein [Nocardioides sp. cx-173]UGB41374.1 beta-propeller domain-containing protein [Nocardioides sp. cx-173]